MFCPNCGTNLDDSARFCGNCGQTLTPVATEAPAPTAVPMGAPAATYPTIITSKKEFVEKAGTPQIKQAWLISLILFGICALLLVLGLNSALNGQFYDIPILGMIMGDDAKDDVKQAQKSLTRDLERLDSVLDEEDLSAKETKLVKSVIKSYKKLVKTVSISGVTEVSKKLEKTEDLLGDTDIFDEMLEIMNIFTIIIYVFFGIPAIFTVFGGIKRSVGLMVTGLIFAMIFFLVFGGIVLGLLALVAYIVQIVFASKVNKAYKVYKAIGAAV